MKKYLHYTFALAIAASFSVTTVAQTVDTKTADKAVNKAAAKSAIAACGCCTQGGASNTSPVILALDLDKDGQISALEIRNSVQSLSALDADGNGHLTREEMHAKSEFSNVNSSVASNNRSKLQLGMTPEKYVETMLYKYDKDASGEIEKSEMPARLLSFLKHIDSNGDEVLTKAELLNINNQLKANYRKVLDKKLKEAGLANSPEVKSKPVKQNRRRKR